MLIPAIVEQWAVKVSARSRPDNVRPQVIIAWWMPDEFDNTTKPVPITKDGAALAAQGETLLIALTPENARKTALRLLEQQRV